MAWDTEASLGFGILVVLIFPNCISTISNNSDILIIFPVPIFTVWFGIFLSIKVNIISTVSSTCIKSLELSPPLTKLKTLPVLAAVMILLTTEKVSFPPYRLNGRRMRVLIEFFKQNSLISSSLNLFVWPLKVIGQVADSSFVSSVRP